MAVDGSGPEAAAPLEDGESRMRGLASGHGATEESNDDRDALPPDHPELAARPKERAPEVHQAFEDLSHAVFADAALPERTKEVIAVAATHVTQCPYGINGHTRRARRKGAARRRSWRRSGTSHLPATWRRP
jgi:AhpD family alkylhydroperoxidase